jgi:hypothetical protein
LSAPSGIGLDLDNTIIDYTAAFGHAAEMLGIAFPVGGKTALRDAVRAQPDGEQRWREMQAYVYGPGLAHARAFPGVATFFAHARERDVALRIISHKTRTATVRPDVDLRAAALAWLASQPFAAGVPVEFADTRERKLEVIASANLTVFVDDLVEVLGDPRFPSAVERWLFAPGGGEAGKVADRVFRAWSEMTDAAFGG